MSLSHHYSLKKLLRAGYTKPGDGDCCCKCKYSSAKEVGQMYCTKLKTRVSKFGICPQYDPQVKTP